MVSFECKICNYRTIRKNDFKKHLNTKKHKLKEENKGVDATKKSEFSSQKLTIPHKSCDFTSQNLRKTHKLF